MSGFQLKEVSTSTGKQKNVERLVLGLHTIKANLTCYTGQQGEYFVSIIPSLNISGYGKTEDEAFEDVRYNSKVFCEDLFSVEEDLRKAELSKLGWTSDKIFRKRFSKSYVDENGVLQNFDFPEKVKRTVVEAT